MIDQEIIQGRWEEVRRKLRERWSQLTDDDLGHFEGDVDQLVGKIHQKTGAARASVERYLAQVTDRLGGLAESLEEGATRTRGMLAEGYAEAEEIIRDRPGQSMAVALGVGIVAGLGLAVLLRERPPGPPRASRRTANLERFGQQLLESLSSAVPDSITDRLRR